MRRAGVPAPDRRDAWRKRRNIWSPNHRQGITVEGSGTVSSFTKLPISELLPLASSSMVLRIPSVPTGGENDTEAGEFRVMPSSDTMIVSVGFKQAGPEKARSSQSTVVI